MIIANDTQLRQYIPNVFATVEGEDTLYEKMTPFLQNAEDWFSREIFPIGEFSSQTDYAATTLPIYLAPIVVNEAFRAAIPSLDIVLTANGFGIINNQNTAPASKDRVERLIASIRSFRDSTIANYITYLDLQNYWKSSKYYSKFHQTIFPSLTIANDCDELFDGWKKRTSHFVAIENEMAQRYISPELYANLRIVDECSAGANVLHVLNTLRFIEKSKYLGDHIATERDLTRIVSVLKSSADPFFECWKTSDTAKLFEDHSFKNKKNSPGFWA